MSRTNNIRKTFQVATKQFLCSEQPRYRIRPTRSGSTNYLLTVNQDDLYMHEHSQNFEKSHIDFLAIWKYKVLSRSIYTSSTTCKWTASSNELDNDCDIYDKAITSDNLSKTIKRLNHLNLFDLMDNQNIHSKKHFNDKPLSKKIKNDLRVASVLIPFCRNSNNEVSILFTLRASRLNKHGGEISFPGGQQDPEDNGDCLVTAKRETREELNIKDEDMVIVGQLNPVPSRYGTIIVPVIGRLNVDLSKPMVDSNKNDQKFKCLSHNNINLDYSHCFQANIDEVDKVYVVPLRLLYESRNWHSTRWKNYNIPTPLFWLRHPLDKSSELPRIWGVTGAILYICLSGLVPSKFSSLDIY